MQLSPPDADPVAESLHVQCTATSGQNIQGCFKTNVGVWQFNLERKLEVVYLHGSKSDFASV